MGTGIRAVVGRVTIVMGGGRPNLRDLMRTTGIAVLQRLGRRCRAGIKARRE
jgi:hypothetical protein